MLVGLWEANVTITITGLGAVSNKANTKLSKDQVSNLKAKGGLLNENNI